MDLPTTLGVVVTAVAGVAAIGSWRAAAKANKAAERANATADALAHIERDRWHTELTPKLQVELTGAASGRAELKVTLSGPPGLDQLDELSISVRDDGDDHPVTAGMSEQEAQEASQVIWGPYRFVRGVSGASRNGRYAPSEGTVAQGDGIRRAMEETPAPSWVAATENWRDRYKDKRVRLTFTCVREGYRPWTIPWEGIVQELPVVLANASPDGVSDVDGLPR
jgi:hypothetical protein